MVDKHRREAEPLEHIHARLGQLFPNSECPQPSTGLGQLDTFPPEDVHLENMEESQDESRQSGETRNEQIPCLSKRQYSQGILPNSPQRNIADNAGQ